MANFSLGLREGRTDHTGLVGAVDPGQPSTSERQVWDWGSGDTAQKPNARNAGQGECMPKTGRLIANVITFSTLL